MDIRVELKHCECCGSLFCRTDKRVYCRQCSPRMERTPLRPVVRMWFPPKPAEVWARGMRAYG